MEILMFIQLVLTLSIVLMIKTKFYDDEEFTEKVKAPIWIYLLISVVGLIPFVGILWFLFCCGCIITLLRDEDVYYKPGWFVKILLKEV